MHVHDPHAACTSDHRYVYAGQQYVAHVLLKVPRVSAHSNMDILKVTGIFQSVLTAVYWWQPPEVPASPKPPPAAPIPDLSTPPSASKRSKAGADLQIHQQIYSRVPPGGLQIHYRQPSLRGAVFPPRPLTVPHMAYVAGFQYHAHALSLIHI